MYSWTCPVSSDILVTTADIMSAICALTTCLHVPGCDSQCRCPDLQGVQRQWAVVLMQWLADLGCVATAAACQPHLHATCPGFVQRLELQWTSRQVHTIGQIVVLCKQA